METKKKDEWFYDEAFWDHFAPIMFDEQRWAEVSAVADGIEALYMTYGAPCNALDGAPGMRVPTGIVGATVAGPLTILDQCCGLGRLSVELARRGHQVTGIDITCSYLEAARESAQHEGLAIEFIEADVRYFVRLDSYHLVVNLYTSFGYFEEQADDRQVVANAYESLVPGGLYVIETLGKELAVRDFTEGEWFERSGAVVLTEFEPLADWEYLKNRWILLKDGQRFERSFNQRLYAATELKRIMLEAGFVSVMVFGDWDRRPYDMKAQKLIVMGRK
ncbi:class I SAM-dependent methyltransferase [Gracilinema caldarium]|uniref:Methyltransferase type 11 n=1 Tax=Gracilinema caldarium (strain ATCC 51460 / DSM 7334 / H1) TaxID=744872 RepID=F8F3V6_GRAC1|nr:methyltransferase domain-containing protein [Gracilinema caldarium]AEJ20475.1 Methyltransferase type 11 [Gracilinema caldarium DSM 7334]